MQNVDNNDVIIAGDFNQIWNNVLDRSGRASSSRPILKSQIAIDLV